MRSFAIGTMLMLGLAVGCEKPIEGIPSSGGSGVSAGDNLSVEMPVEDSAAPPPVVPGVDPTLPTADPSLPVPDPTLPADPDPSTLPSATDPAPTTDDTKQSSTGTAAAGKFVTASLKVPTMTCPHGCWPAVKEALAAQPGVESVELAKQSKADEIDNPVVHVKLKGKFDSKAAVAALAKAGFENAEVVN